MFTLKKNKAISSLINVSRYIHRLLKKFYEIWYKKAGCWWCKSRNLNFFYFFFRHSFSSLFLILNEMFLCVSYKLWINPFIVIWMKYSIPHSFQPLWFNYNDKHYTEHNKHVSHVSVPKYRPDEYLRFVIVVILWIVNRYQAYTLQAFHDRDIKIVQCT